MANQLDPAGKQLLIGAGNWVADNFDVIAVDAALFTYAEGTTTNRSDIPAGARVATSALVGKAISATGVISANDVTFTTVSGAQFENLIIVANTGVEANDTIICFIDTSTGLPLTPNGLDITVTWDAQGIAAY